MTGDEPTATTHSAVPETGEGADAEFRHMIRDIRNPFSANLGSSSRDLLETMPLVPNRFTFPGLRAPHLGDRDRRQYTEVVAPEYVPQLDPNTRPTNEAVRDYKDKQGSGMYGGAPKKVVIPAKKITDYFRGRDAPPTMMERVREMIAARDRGELDANFNIPRVRTPDTVVDDDETIDPDTIGAESSTDEDTSGGRMAQPFKTIELEPNPADPDEDIYAREELQPQNLPRGLPPPFPDFEPDDNEGTETDDFGLSTADMQMIIDAELPPHMDGRGFIKPHTVRPFFTMN